ncbi:MAG: cobyrinate a,c-diamide synthase [Pseudomonadota bacterium]
MQQSFKKVPGLVIAGLRGGSGKTVISLGIAAAWKEIGITVSPFKKGPDYIDAGWLSQAAGRPCYNLDTFLCTPDQVTISFGKASASSDIAVVEGNRGLFDGIDTDGRTSTAEIAKLLNLPVLLVLDCTKSTRTMAALLMGCIHFDPELHIMGVILNQVAGKRHEGKVRDNIAKFCKVPVFGAVPKLGSEDFPERHMGLIPSVEHEMAGESIRAAADVARRSIDLDALYRACIDHFKSNRNRPAPSAEDLPGIASDKESKSCSENKVFAAPFGKPGEKVPVIGIVRDCAFQFYYPDNLEALEREGARLITISPLRESSIPPVDAIYMGGGFPETHAPELAANTSFRHHLRQLAQNGLPIYAECGGLIFLGESLILDGITYPMTGVFPITFGLSKRPEGHGYTTVTVVNDNPFYQMGEVIRGHEFRYSSILNIDYKDSEMAFSMNRGRGIINKRDGFCKWRVLGTYTHILAPGTDSWAKGIVRNAFQYMREQKNPVLLH